MDTLPDFFEKSVEKFPENIFLWEKSGDHYEGITYREVHEKVALLAAGLLSSGVKKSDRIALLSEGRNSWVICELAIFYTGAINVPLSVRLSGASEISFRLNHSEAGLIFVSGNQVKKIRSVKKELPLLKNTILLDDIPTEGSDEILFSRLLEMGLEYSASNPSALNHRKQSVRPDDPANICYTSGTTADPKGIVLTHRNYLTNIKQGYSLMGLSETSRTLLMLPWDHAFAHTAGIYCFMGKGASIASVQPGKTTLESIRNIQQNIREIKPHILFSVPALAANYKRNIEKSVREKGWLANWMFHHALQISYRYNKNGWDKGSGLTLFFKPLIYLFDKLIFKNIRKAFGGRLQFFIGGGALLNIEFQHFFYALGIPMFQGYGLTEASPIISSNTIDKHKLGSSGILVSEMELKICDNTGKTLPQEKQGEIVVRGQNVMQGYWKNQTATDAAIRDGWLFTGDLGYLDVDNFLYVLGRFKSLLIGRDGEKFSPEGIEESIVAHSDNIDQCLLYNDQSPYTAAFIVPNKESLKRYLKNKGCDPLSEEGKKLALQAIEQDLSEYRPKGKFEALFPQRWLPSAIILLAEPFSEENRFMNSTAKMVRGKIIEHYKKELEFLYTPEAKNIANHYNLQSLERFFTSG